MERIRKTFLSVEWDTPGWDTAFKAFSLLSGIKEIREATAKQKQKVVTLALAAAIISPTWLDFLIVAVDELTQ